MVNTVMVSKPVKLLTSIAYVIKEDGSVSLEMHNAGRVYSREELTGFQEMISVLVEEGSLTGRGLIRIDELERM